MGKATKRERQKLNRSLREEEREKQESRKKVLRLAKTIGLILIVPIVVGATIFINNATDPDVYSAKMTIEIEGVDQEDLLNGGVIEIVLDNADSPNSVKHFNGFASNQLYDGFNFHRVRENSVIETGDPNGDGTGSIGSPIVAEIPEREYRPGDVAWVKNENEPAGTAGSQFFIITGDEDSEGLQGINTKVAQPDGSEVFDYGYIGRVTGGLELAKFIEELAPTQESATNPAGDGPPTKEVTLVSVEVFKNGDKIDIGDLIPATTLPGENQPDGNLPEGSGIPEGIRAQDLSGEANIPEEAPQDSP